MHPYSEVPTTREEVFKLIDAGWTYPANSALKSIFDIYRKQYPEESIEDTWMRLLNHIIAIYEKG